MRRILAILVLVAAGALAAPAVAFDPNDPAWFAQWAHRKMRVHQVWDYTTGSENVVIAVVDTGVDGGSVDVGPALVGGWDFTTGDANQTDTHGHGSYIASQLIARGNNGVGMAGYCWRCRLMPIRVTREGWAESAAIAAGIRWAVDHGARIVTVSFSRPGGQDSAERNAVAYARARGVLVVASAGNDGSSAVGYPAGYPGVLAVTGTDENDDLYPWAARGDWVALAAPGCQMVIAPNNVYGRLCGTSVTAPAVAGVAALLLSVNPSLTPEQIEWALRSTAAPVAGISGGRVDAFAALTAIGLPAFNPPPVVALPAAAPPAPTGPAPPAATQPVAPAPPPTAASTRRGAVRYQNHVRIDVGVLRSSRRLLLDLAGGRVGLTFTSNAASECTLTFVSPNDIVIGMPRTRREIALVTSVRRGRYAVEINCQSRRIKRYTLGIAANQRVFR